MAKKKLTDEQIDYMATKFIECREKKGMNQVEFAGFLEIEPRMVRKYEQRKATIPDYVKIALVLKCGTDMSDFICKKDNCDYMVKDEKEEFEYHFTRILEHSNPKELLAYSSRINEKLNETM